jgi:hypothetical protein
VVELDTGGRFHLRQLNADKKTGAFTDLDRVYSPAGVSDAPPAAALVLGDTHARYLDPHVERATFGEEGGIVPTLRPKVLVVNDLLDGDTINPHRKGDPFAARALHVAGAASVEAEVRHACELVRRWSELASVVLSPSNHDDFLRRWLVSHDWRTDPSSAEWYLETALATLRGARQRVNGVYYPSPFGHWVGRLAPRVRCLEPGESYEVEGIELGMHGHLGPNGARGSLRNLSRLGARVVSGHSHTPGIEEGHYQVGTSSRLRLEYNVGPSAWLQTHCVIYASGKRALLTVVDGHWRA